MTKGISETELKRFRFYHSDRPFGVSWRGEVSKSQFFFLLGYLRAQCLDHFISSIYMSSLGSAIWKHLQLNLSKTAACGLGQPDTTSPFN